MKRYEYMCFSLPNVTADDLLPELNRLGGEGWEVFSISSRESEIVRPRLVWARREVAAAAGVEVRT